MKIRGIFYWESYNKSLFAGVGWALLYLFFNPSFLPAQDIVDAENARQILAKGLELQDRADYAGSNHYLKLAGNWFEQHSDLQRAAHCFNHVSSNFNLMSQLDSAETYAARALELVSGLVPNKTEEIRACTLLGLVNARRAKYDAARHWLERAAGLIDRESINTTLKVTVIGSLGYLYDDLGEYDKAIDLYLQGLEMITSDPNPPKEQIAKLYNNLGYSHTNKGLYNHALEYYRKELETGLEIKGPAHPDIAGAYINIGSGYYRKGDWGEAQMYFQRSLDIILERFGEEHNMAALNYDNMGLCYIELGLVEDAIANLQKAVNIKLKISDPDHPDIAETYKHISTAYAEMDDYDSALRYLEKALAIQQAGLGNQHPRLAETYNLLGEYYIEQGRNETAITYLNQSRKIITNSSAPDHPALAVSYTLSGRARHQMGDHTAGLSDIRQALQLLAEDFEPRNQFVNPALSSISYPFYAVNTLFEKATILHARGLENAGGRKDNYLESSLSTFVLLSGLLDQLQSDFVNEQSKLAITKKSHTIYEKAIQVSHDLYLATADPYYLKQAFVFAEKSKSRVLLEQLNKNRVQHFAGIPDSLVQYEQELKYRTNRIREEIDRELFSDVMHSTRLPALRDSLFNLKRDLNRHVEYLKQHYPRYHELHYLSGVMPVSEIQQGLNSDEAVIEYVAGDKLLYVFVITDEIFRLHRLPVADLEEEVSLFKDALSGREKNLYLQKGRHLYRELFEPLTADLEGKSCLYIVPDKSLALIPFGALLTEDITGESTYQYLPYLIRQYSINTLPSVTLADVFKERERTDFESEFYAFAPVFDHHILADDQSSRQSSGDEWPYLPFSLDEVRNIAALFKARENFWNSIWNRDSIRLLTREEATKAAFKKISGTSVRYIHLATHAFVSSTAPDSAGVVFYPPPDDDEDGILFSREIYNLSLPSDLVILSACETGGGTIIRGEGVMGLSRAFQYAGSSSLLASLWKIDDRSTSSLMVHFYRYLTRGAPKQESLRRAQLELIADSRFSHPFHWASFILIGL